MAVTLSLIWTLRTNFPSRLSSRSEFLIRGRYKGGPGTVSPPPWISQGGATISYFITKVAKVELDKNQLKGDFIKKISDPSPLSEFSEGARKLTRRDLPPPRPENPVSAPVLNQNAFSESVGGNIFLDSFANFMKIL